MAKLNVVKTGKQLGSKVWESALFLVPAVGGGAIGAGIGRNSFLFGLGTIALARWRKWPDWVQYTGVGMAVNGVATALPVNGNGNGEAQATANGEEDILSGIPFVQDGFMPRASLYLKNIALKAHIDKIPGVNKMIGLSGVEQAMLSNRNRRVSLNNLTPQIQSEINRIIGQMGTGNDGGSLSGIESKLLSSPGSMRDRRRRVYS